MSEIAKIHTHKVMFAALAAMAVALSVAMLVSSLATPVQAKISPVTTDVSCTNGGGNQPGGQQPSCEGSGLTQDTETENQNPSGAAPPGQN
jgi:hypothetical protein